MKGQKARSLENTTWPELRKQNLQVNKVYYFAVVLKYKTIRATFSWSMWRPCAFVNNPCSQSLYEFQDEKLKLIVCHYWGENRCLSWKKRHKNRATWDGLPLSRRFNNLGILDGSNIITNAKVVFCLHNLITWEHDYFVPYSMKIRGF